MIRQAFFGKNLTFFGNFFEKFFCDFSPHKMRGSSPPFTQDTQKGRSFPSPFYTIYYSGGKDAPERPERERPCASAAARARLAITAAMFDGLARCGEHLPRIRAARLFSAGGAEDLFVEFFHELVELLAARRADILQ